MRESMTTAEELAQAAGAVARGALTDADIIGKEVTRANYDRMEWSPRRILVVGIPRSGTTWVASALSGCKEAVYVDEPDDERRFKITRDAKNHLGRYPIIAPGDTDTVGGYSIRAYYDMWQKAWDIGNEFAPKNVILKSALAPFCLEWVVENFEVDAVIWSDRYPLNSLASWVEYAKKAHPETNIKQLIKRMVWQYGLLYQTYCRLERNGYIQVRTKHEQLAADFTLFEGVAKQLGLEWTYRSAEWLNDMDKEGEGGHWGLEEYSREGHLTRPAAEQRINRYRSRLNEQEVKLIVDLLKPWEEAFMAVMQEAF